MTDREKLKQLLINTPNCDNECSLCGYNYTDDKCEEHLSGIMADHLLSNNVVVLPCKIGDVVYVIDNKRPCYACTFCTDFCHKDCSFPDRLNKVIKKATIEQIAFESNQITITVNVPETETTVSHKIEFLSTDFNKAIFFSEEKAEAKLKECI